jgi:hypothetical protein
MIEGIKNIIELFLDKSRHWTLKAGVFISVIGLLFVLDFMFNLSYNYFINNKLENIEKLQVIKKGYSDDTLKLKKIEELEENVINEKHYSESFFLSFNSFKKSIIPNTTDQNVDNKNTPKNATNKKNIRSPFLMLLTSNLLFLILLIILVFRPFFDKELKSLKTLSSWFASMTILITIITITVWLSFQIPILYNQPIYNYVLNFILHVILIIGIVKIFGKNGTITIY